VTVAVAAGTTTWQLYAGGILNACDSSLDHAVLLVGYDVDNKGVPFYRLKNQWGASWGESGFVRVARSATCGNNGASGVQMEPVFPIV
jgi:aminopeptidase C